MQLINRKALINMLEKRQLSLETTNRKKMASLNDALIAGNDDTIRIANLEYAKTSARCDEINQLIANVKALDIHLIQ